MSEEGESSSVQAESERQVTCYLCLRRVSLTAWRQGGHRQDCLLKHQHVLNKMKSPENSKIRQVRVDWSDG